MGRPRLTDERRGQIVDAFLASVIERGLHHSSIAVVANALGLDRSTVHHYFRTREALVTAAMGKVIASYRQQFDDLLTDSPPGERSDLFLDHVFGATFNDPELAAILLEFRVAARNDPKAMTQLRRAYRGFEKGTLAELERAFPRAPAAERRRVAHAVIQLSEGASAFHSMGFGKDLARAARGTAERLLAGLARARS